jgi:hypothetical protein
MKNISIKIAALIFAFLLGVSAFVFYYIYSIPKISEPALIKSEETFDCGKVKSFPGLSQKISVIEKFKGDYFPKNTFTDGWENSDAFFNEWYAGHLKAMGEKSLIKVSDQNPEIYRFLWLRTFHHPIFVRVERTSAHSFDLISKELSGAGDYEPGRVLRTAKHSLTEDEWCEFIQLLNKSNYWKMPAFLDERGFDGSEWILEGVKDGRYHVVSRWSPDSGEYREACIYLLKLSYVDVDRLKDDLY